MNWWIIVLNSPGRPIINYISLNTCLHKILKIKTEINTSILFHAPVSSVSLAMFLIQ